MDLIKSEYRIHWFSWLPTPYNDFLFERLSGDDKIELTVHFRSCSLPSHPWKTDLTRGYHARCYRLSFGVDWYVLSQPFLDRHAYFVIGGWDHPTSQILLTLLRILGLRYILWTDTPDLERSRPELYRRIRSVWLRWIFSGARKILGTGRPGVLALETMGAPKEKISNFPYWIDLDAYKPRSDRTKFSTERAVRFVSCGRIENNIKGHDVAVRALARAARKCRVPFEYVIAGVGPDEAKLTTLSMSLGVAKQVKLRGWLEPEQLRQLLQDSDVLIHPSPRHEPYGVAVIEAMASGLVVMASDKTCAALDRIEDGVNGFIHSAGNVRALSEQINSLLRRPECIKDIGLRARETAKLWPVERAIADLKSVLLLNDANDKQQV